MGAVSERKGERDEYVSWLQEKSMLADASRIAGQFSGIADVWQSPFANPNPAAVMGKSSVWFTAYPISMITKPGQSFLGTLGDEDLWRVFQAIGINAVHTGPLKRAGGLFGRKLTPSVDGHFDRISTQIDEVFGTETEFRRLCDAAAIHGGVVIDDIVPGHTGKGPDFRLAEMKVGDYPGIYHMVEIPPEDWHLLPEVPPGRDSVNLDSRAEDRLQHAGYIVGRLQRVIFQDPGIKDTNWSATAAVTGPDGVERRWVYLHYFKDGQPSINWLDPTFAGMRLVIGDALHSLGHLGAGALRLDANGFLGIERSADGDGPAWSEGHPLSEAANHLIASMVRKVGGFTFQELNLSIDDIKKTSEHGADLSYDFVNRPAYAHALATGDTEFLRLTLNAALRHGLQPVRLVHALQNHDEMTYELVHFAIAHRDDIFGFRGSELTGGELAVKIRNELIERLTGEAAPYNAIFTTNGIASTTATIITAALGYADITNLSQAQIAKIKRAHLLLAMFNAWQPGVLALSGWDLCGMLTLERSRVSRLLASGDTRWIHRAAYDLMDYQVEATESASKMPRGSSLYGSLPDQLKDPNSFASRLREILAVRSRYGIATSVQVDVPEVSSKAMLVMVHRLDSAQLQLTVLNFDSQPIAGRVTSEHLGPGSAVTDMVTGQVIAEVDPEHSFAVSLESHQGMSLLSIPAAAQAKQLAANQWTKAPPEPREHRPSHKAAPPRSPLESSG
jgi:trehalose synthase